jgi:hypothetical protein
MIIGKAIFTVLFIFAAAQASVVLVQPAAQVESGKYNYLVGI